MLDAGGVVVTMVGVLSMLVSHHLLVLLMRLVIAVVLAYELSRCSVRPLVEVVVACGVSLN